MRVAGTKGLRRLVKAIFAAVVGGGLALAGGTMAASSASAHTWAELQPIGLLPGARNNASAVHDQTSNRLILFGGYFPGCCIIRDDIWILTNADGLGATKPRWTNIVVDAPIDRAYQSAAYNPTSNRMIVFGGQSNDSYDLHNDVWILTDANGVSGAPQWQQLLVKAGPHPFPRAGQTAVYDKPSNRLIIFGGFFNPGTPWAVRDDTWVLTNADGSGAAQSQWIPLAQTGPRPPGRERAFAAYDIRSNQMLMFGGNDFAGNSFNDVWILHNANGRGAKPSYWAKSSPLGIAPGPRWGLTGGYNPNNHKLVIFGGTDNTTMTYNDTWLLINAFGASPMWVQRTPIGVIPPPLSVMAGAYLPKKDKLLVTSGSLVLSCCDFTNKTFVLRGATK